MISIILAVILGIVFAALAIQNPSFVPVNLFGLSFNVPLYLLAAITFILGSLLTMVFYLFDRARQGITIHNMDTKVNEIAEDNHALRNQLQKVSLENERLRLALSETKGEVREEKNRNILGRAKPRLA